jgi:PAS domain S-box-containing protein
MPPMKPTLTGRERHFDRDEIIVSKTDLAGRITYANRVFCRVAQFTEIELLGKPHNIIRHPDMPKCIFKFLWDTIQAGNEIFAYVVNRAKSGDHYWVFAHVTPTFGTDNQIVGYHSSRRLPDRAAVDTMASLYRTLLAEEHKHTNPKDGMNAALTLLTGLLEEQRATYDEFIFQLARKNPTRPKLQPTSIVSA